VVVDPVRNVRVVDPVPFAPSPRERLKSFMKIHGRKLWWVHSAYALGLGVAVVVFAQKGFDPPSALRRRAGHRAGPSSLPRSSGSNS
jgi:hypothetical protein